MKYFRKSIQFTLKIILYIKKIKVICITDTQEKVFENIAGIMRCGLVRTDIRY